MHDNNKKKRIKAGKERSFLKKKKAKEENNMDWRYAKSVIFSLIIKTVSQNDKETYK